MAVFVPTGINNIVQCLRLTLAGQQSINIYKSHCIGQRVLPPFIHFSINKYDSGEDGKKKVGDKPIGRRARIESCQLMSNLFRFTGIQYATGVLCDTATQNFTFPSIADLRKHKGSNPMAQKIVD
jgi:hypothetical protein